MAKRRKKSNTQLQSPLPTDVLLEILQRLPVSSLLRFTSVSKLWEASIKNPTFITSYHHHHHHHDKTSAASHLLFMSSSFWCYSLRTCFLIPETSTSGPITNYNPILKFTSTPIVVGSCQGLICIKTERLLKLWNPFMRTSLIRVPAGEIPVSTEPRKGKPLSIELGFGFAPKSSDHRVVKLFCNDKHLSEVEIYSLASDSWRRIKPTYIDEINSMKFRFGISSVYLDGSIYWSASLYGNETYSNIILRFDLEEEKFEEIALPSFLGYSPTEYDLAIIKGFLVIWRVRVGFKEINVQAYIKRNANGGSELSSWVLKTISIPRPDGETLVSRYETTTYGHIVVIGDEHKSVLAYDGYCDGKDLSFKLRDLGIISEETEYSYYSCIIPITETLFLFDKK